MQRAIVLTYSVPEATMEAIAAQPTPSGAVPQIDAGSWASPGYRSAGTRARWAQIFFVLVGLGGLMQVAFLSQGMNLVSSAMSGEIVSDAAWATYLKNSTDADNFYSGAALCLAITFIAWLSRTVENVPPLGGGIPKDSPRWAIGWWFVPIAFLFKPYMVVRDAWQRMSTSTRSSGAMIVAIWWLGFIGATMLGRYVNAATASADLDSINTLFMVGIAGGILAIASAVCGFLVVREIQTRANDRAGSLGLLVAKATWPTSITAHASIGLAGDGKTPNGGFCPSCGTKRAVAGRYCATCGTELGVN